MLPKHPKLEHVALIQCQSRAQKCIKMHRFELNFKHFLGAMPQTSFWGGATASSPDSIPQQNMIPMLNFMKISSAIFKRLLQIVRCGQCHPNY